MQEIIETINSMGLKEVFFGSSGFSIADESSIKDSDVTKFTIHHKVLSTISAILFIAVNKLTLRG